MNKEHGSSYTGFRQYLSEKEKDEDWVISAAQYITAHNNFSSTINFDKLYRAYNGYLEQEDYTYITAPTGSKMGKIPKDAKYPARLRNYPIIKPIVDLLVGEKSKRFKGWQVVVSNPDSVNVYREELNKKLRAVLEQRTINILNKMGVDTGMESQQVPTPQQIVDQFKQDYKDERAIIGADALEYITLYNNIYDHFLRGFLDFVVTGAVTSYRGIENGDIDYEIFPPNQLEFEKSPGSIFIEDSSWVKRTWELTNTQVLDMFSEDFKDEKDLLLQLENPQNDSITGSEPYSVTTYITSGSVGIGEDTSGVAGSRDRLITVEHCVFRAFRKVGIVEDIDEYGQSIIVEVDETYQGNNVLEWNWLSDIWEVYVINGNIYKRGRRWPYQLNKLNRSKKIPLPYNGRIYSDRNSEPQSVVKIGLAYQALYNIIKYKLEMMIAKSKDKIILMDYSAIPRDQGWDEFKFMYFVDAFGYMFVDRKKADKSFNQYTVLDASLGQYIRDMIMLLESIKQDYEDVIGINRQRKGQFAASDSVGTSQFALGQSAVINEELFKKFEEFEERELEHLISLSQYAWRDGKKSMFVSSDRRNVMLDIEPDVYCDTDYGVFITNNAIENEKLNRIKGLVDRIAQNPNTTNKELAEIIDADNYSKLKEKLEKADELKRQYEQQVQEQKMKEIEAINADKEKERESKAIESELDRQNNIDVAMINNLGTIAAKGAGMQPEVAPENSPEMLITRFKAEVDKQMNREKNQVAREKIAADLKKAELDAKTKLKNPVVGEKKK